MDLDDMKRIAQTMAENGILAELITDDFEYTIEAHPSSHPEVMSEINTAMES